MLLLIRRYGIIWGAYYKKKKKKYTEPLHEVMWTLWNYTDCHHDSYLSAGIFFSFFNLHSMYGTSKISKYITNILYVEGVTL